uniref:Uncharacterized protein n=2 Tax=Brassica oleracea TaxID=3712 RepID=A0A0D3ED37_BRAOL|nr:unnamed protein product [Brassica oleracea]
MSVGIFLSIDVFMSKNASIDERLRKYPDEVLPRYEFQKGRSIIVEIRFPDDPEWVISREVIEFWRSKREVESTPHEE